MSDLEKTMNRLRNMKQNKNKSEEEIKEQAEKILAKKELELEFVGLKEDEEKKAYELYEKYISENSFESLAEKSSLIDLITKEVIKQKLQKQILESDVPPLHMIETMDKISNGIKEDKRILGMLQEKNENNDASKTIDNLLYRFHRWANRPENRSNFEFQCPNCEEIYLIRRRLDKEKDEVKGHPWFIDGGILFNKEIFKDLDEGKISEEQVARYLNATVDYVKWIRVNYPLNQDIEIEEENEEEQ